MKSLEEGTVVVVAEDKVKVKVTVENQITIKMKIMTGLNSEVVVEEASNKIIRSIGADTGNLTITEAGTIEEGTGNRTEITIEVVVNGNRTEIIIEVVVTGNRTEITIEVVVTGNRTEMTIGSLILTKEVDVKIIKISENLSMKQKIERLLEMTKILKK